jgi:hypothetical protein
MWSNSSRTFRKSPSALTCIHDSVDHDDGHSQKNGGFPSWRSCRTDVPQVRAGIVIFNLVWSGSELLLSSQRGHPQYLTRRGHRVCAEAASAVSLRRFSTIGPRQLERRCLASQGCGDGSSTVDTSLQSFPQDFSPPERELHKETVGIDSDQVATLQTLYSTSAACRSDSST